MVKKKKNNLRGLVGYSMTMGGAALLGDKFPGSMGTPIGQVATTGSKFVKPMAVVTGAGMTMDALGKLKPKKKYKKGGKK